MIYIESDINGEKYLKYIEFMKKNENNIIDIYNFDKEERRKNLQSLYKLIILFFDNRITRSDLASVDRVDLFEVAYEIVASIETTIHMRLSDFGNISKVEKEESIFDDYDKEMGIKYDSSGKLIVEGISKVGKEKSKWEVYRECINSIFQKAIDFGNNSIRDCMQSNLITTIDTVDYNLRNFDSSLKFQELQAKANSII